MKNRKMMIGMAAVFLLMMGWQTYLTHFVYPKHPEWDVSGNHNKGPVAEQPTTAPSATQPVATTWPASTNPSVMTPTTIPSTELRLSGLAETARTVQIGSIQPNDGVYPLGMQLTSLGAAIDAVTLNQYKAVTAERTTDKLYTFEQPYADHDDTRPLETRTITVNGQTLDVGDKPWKVEVSASDVTSFGIDVSNGAGVPILHVDKIFKIESQGPEKNRDDTPGGYEITVTYQLHNLTRDPQTVQIDFTGPTEPPQEVERGADRQVIAGYDKGDSAIDIVRHGIEEFKTGADTKDLYKHDKGYKFLWAGQASAYFAAIVRPDPTTNIARLQTKALMPDSHADDHEVVLTFGTQDLKLDRAGTLEVPLKVYFGPKKRGLLEGTYYSTFPRNFNAIINTSSSFCGICAFPWLIDRLVDLLGIFHFVFRDWGLAIIALVIIVRLCLHPITKQSQVSMLKMQKMGPELERLKKKYGDDKEAYTKAQMEVYKSVGFTPVLGCLPMFLQMPIWIALYSALQSEISLRQAHFLWGFTWIYDLARPDRLFHWDSHPLIVPFLGTKIISFNVLPVLLAGVFFLQQKYTPKPPAATPEQAQQQKMMQWMSLLFPIFLYTAPSGLNLYILTSTTIGILESKRIRDHIKQREEAEKAGRVIIDAKPTRAGKQSRKDEKGRDIAEDEKPGCLMGWWMTMQQKVEQIRQEAERANKKN